MKLIFLLLLSTQTMAYTVCKFEQKDRKIDFSWLSKKKIELKFTANESSGVQGSCTADLASFQDNKSAVIPNYKLIFNFLNCDSKTLENEVQKEWQLIIRNPEGETSHYTMLWSKFTEPDECTVGGEKSQAKKELPKPTRSTATVLKKKK